MAKRWCLAPYNGRLQHYIQIKYFSFWFAFAVCRELLTELQIRQNELKEDHQRKSQALSLDTNCMGIREKLPSHESQVKNQCDKNMKLTGTLRNASRYLENSTVVK